MQQEQWTIGRLLTWTTDYLKQHGSDSPRLEAEVLLAHAQECQRIELYTAFNDAAREDVRAAFRALVRRRAEGTPVAYLVGQKEFYSLAFFVSPDVLIPRPETEMLVMALLDKVAERGDQPPPRIVDVGTGSGILAVCAAKFLPQAKVTAVDICPAALQVARRNAQQHQVSDRIDFRESDLLNAVDPQAQFDFVLSNPPYVSADEFAQLPLEVKNHEPRQALLAGPTGCEVIERLVGQAAERLPAGGWLILEISPMIRDQVVQLLGADGRYENIQVQNDLAKLARQVTAQRS